MNSLFIAGLLVYWYSFCEADLHPCDRNCEWPQKPMRCEYNFTIEWYYAMSKACYNCPVNLTDCSRSHCIPADGFRRPVLSVNRELPGPAIRVCHNDIVIVTVKNKAENDEGVTIHWHGMYMKDAPHMDGVPMVTQCSIPARTSFTYEFTADPPGTHWWHSHSGMQRADGLAGPLIVKTAKEADPHFSLYDHDKPEHVVFVTDWLHQLILTKFLAHHHSFGNNKGESMLINGKGISEKFFDFSSNSTYYTPREIFVVDKDKRYRFRTISNAALFCPYEITVDNHLLKVIASDGADFDSYEVTSLVVHGGERFDFILSSDQTISNYWFRVQGVGDCRNQSQLAILRYFGAPDEIPKTLEQTTDNPDFLQLNPWNQTENVKFTQISSMKPVYSESSVQTDNLKGKPDQIHFIGFDFMKVNNPSYNHPDLYPISEIPLSSQLYTPQLNNISFEFPSYPMLTQPEYINEDETCNPDSETWDRDKSRFCDGDFCSCTYVIDVKLHNLVELVLFDEGRTFDAGHPMHLHGQHFGVVAMDKVGSSLSTEDMKSMHSNGSIQYDFDAPFKDTVIVPDGGYTIIRFVADNPGVWMFHCHLQFHSQIGMEMILRVGEPESWVKPPKDFPKCGTWKGSGSSSSNSLTRPNCLILCSLILFYLLHCRSG